MAGAVDIIHVLVLPTVNHARNSLTDVGACADEEEDDEEEGVEVEERRLSSINNAITSSC